MYRSEINPTKLTSVSFLFGFYQLQVVIKWSLFTLNKMNGFDLYSGEKFLPGTLYFSLHYRKGMNYLKQKLYCLHPC